MLTVIIYRKSSQEFIDKYRTLFELYRDTGKIAFCFWNENGTDLASALPQLTSVVRGERRWKAIIALPMEDNQKASVKVGEEQSRFETKQDNPFDFLCNSEPEPPVKESEVPLIRLTQMLGGVPLVNHHYEYQMVEEIYELDDKEHTVVRQKRLRVERSENDASLEEQQRIWDELNDKYSAVIERPSYLYLLAARATREVQISTVTDIEIQNRHECDSSMFWYRNRYPAKARFLVQDCGKSGNARFKEDQFNFWMTVLMLSLNDIPTGTLEAYKVYNVKSIIDWEKMHRVLSDYYNRLDGARLSALKQILELKKSTQLTRETDERPYYKVEVPVILKTSQEKEVYVDVSHIGLTGDCPVEEEPWFYKVVRFSTKRLEKINRSIRISLDRACISARFAAKVMDEEIHELDEYQFSEMDEELSEKEKEILTFNIYSIFPLKMYERDLTNARKSVTTSMKKRMYRMKAIVTGSLAIAVYFIGFLPDIIYQIMEGTHTSSIIGISLLSSLIIALVGLVCLFYYRRIIKVKIQNYNEVVADYMSGIEKSKGSFSKYLSEVASYMRGRYMLQALERKSTVSNVGIIMLGRHVEHLRAQMDIIMSWLKDFEKSPLPDMGEADRSYIDFDFGIPPEKNGAYFLQLDSYDLSITAFDGSKAVVPYPFVTEIEVKREWLYDKPETEAMKKVIEKGKV